MKGFPLPHLVKFSYIINVIVIEYNPWKEIRIHDSILRKIDR